MEEKEINYFDTPDDRRKGNGGMADFMAGILRAKKKREQQESLLTSPQTNEKHS